MSKMNPEMRKTKREKKEIGEEKAPHTTNLSAATAHITTEVSVLPNCSLVIRITLVPSPAFQMRSVQSASPDTNRLSSAVQHTDTARADPQTPSKHTHKKNAKQI